MTHEGEVKGKLVNGVGSQPPSHRFTLPRNLVYPALLPLMRTTRLPAVNWTDVPADLNGLVRFAERRKLVSACVPSHFKRTKIPLSSGGSLFTATAGNWFFCNLSTTIQITRSDIPRHRSLLLNPMDHIGTSKGRYTLSVNLSDFTVWRHTWRKNWINCAVLTGNSADLKTVLFRHFSHRELRSWLKESHTHSVQFFVQFFYAVKLHILTREFVGSWTR